MLYTAFLRGINVGGHRKIKMAELRSLLENQGCTRVKTYIQSGNIVFEADENTMTGKRLENLILEHYGFEVSIVLLSSQELKQILISFPFGENHPDTAGNKTVFTFIDSAKSSSGEEINKLKEFAGSSEKLVYSKQGYWLHCPEGYGKTKLSNALIEKKLGKSATTRNLRTLKAMVLLTEET